MRLLWIAAFVGLCLAQEDDVTSTLTPTVHPGNFLVVAPKIVRPGRPYTVSVLILKSNEKNHIVRVDIRKNNNDTIVARVVKDAKLLETYTINIENVPEDLLVENEDYKLYVRCETLGGNILFEAQKGITYNGRTLSIFVQTDKAIYKPGTTVKYRVVVVRPDLLPYNNTVSVKIIDPNQNIISQSLDNILSKGVYSSEIQLADEPPLGDWQIQVESKNGVTTKKSFSIEKYVLPKFEVSIKTPPYITTKGNLPIKVIAKYTYGRAVSGKAKVILSPPYQRYDVLVNEDGTTSQGNKVSLLERSVKLNNDGEASVTFENKELREYKFIQEYGSSIDIVAVVTEDLTEIERNSTATVSSYQYDVKIEIEKQGDNYKPGLGYSIVVALKQMDDTPVAASMPKRVQVTSSFEYPWDSTMKVQKVDKEVKIIDLGARGTTIMNLLAPQNTTSLQIEAIYDREGKDNFNNSDITGYLGVDSFLSPSNSFIQLLADNEGTVEAGKKVSFTIRSTEKKGRMWYQVLSRGAIVLHGEKELSGGETTPIEFQTTSDMAPKARLVVYIIKSGNNEILADATDFKINGLFKNNVSLSVNKESAEPGQNVTFKVKADAGSYVGLLAVDQSVLLLKSGNDITRQLVEDDIEQFDATNDGVRDWEAFARRRRRSIWFPWHGISGKDTTEIFQYSGLVVLTDAFLYHAPDPPIPLVLNAPEPEYQSDIAPRTRSKFPESFAWISSSNGLTEFETEVPDTITSWVASAFAVSEQTGLGVAPDTVKLRVFRPFFIRLNLPYSVKRGEKFGVQVLVFNYMDNELDVTVTMKNTNGEFVFLQKDGSISHEEQLSRIVAVPGGGYSKAVYFPIEPRHIGDIKLHVTATSNSAGDAVEMPLKVEPEGYRVERNIPFVVDLSKGEFKKNVKLEFPDDVVDGSKKARFSAIGDMMGPLLNNIDNLIQMPHGCGEQNMLNFVPNIVVVKYLRATNQGNDDLKKKATKHMESGYQRELTFLRHDNSFSAFGNNDDYGSTWLTAFVIRSFAQAKEFIFIDKNIVQRSISFLNYLQMQNGAFQEQGRILHEDMKGGNKENSDSSLTAYVVTAMLENGERNEKAIKYLENLLPTMTSDVYTLAVTAYALKLAGSSKAKAAWDAMEKLKKTTADHAEYWSLRDEPKTDVKSDVFSQPPVNIEITSYALLTVMLDGDVLKAMPIARWLMQQRNPHGGFTSTQDTVVGLQALAAYATKAFSKDSEITVKLQSGNEKHSFDLNAANAIVLQSYDIQDFSNNIDIDASGKGIAFGQIDYSYYRDAKKDNSPFYCRKNLKELRGGARLALELCCNYTRPGKSNMALAEVQSLTGFKFDQEESMALTKINALKRVELDKDDTQVNIYFDALDADPICLSLFSDQVYQVADQKPAQLTLFDYYDPIEQLKTSYSAKQTRSLQSSCVDCWPTADASAALRAGSGTLSGKASSSPSSVLVPVLTTILVLLARRM